MNEPNLQPYLTFNGNCEEAMNFYKDVLGGELEISRFGEFASDQMPVADDYKDKVMHSSLKNGMYSFMGSDVQPGRTAQKGDLISLSIAGSDEAKLTEYFNSLSAGGTVTMPLAKQMWGDTFGMFTDKYGIDWLINITQN